MRAFILILVVFMSFQAFSEETGQSQQNKITIDQIGNDSWMDSYFLTKRFNFLPVIKKYKNELGLTDEQLNIINSFYSKYYKKMEELATSVKEKEQKLNEMILNGGDPKKIKDLIVEIAKDKAELTVYNIKEVRTIQSALTKEQFEKLKNLSDQSII